MPQQQTRTARIEARLSPEALAIVRRAAELQGRSISDFVISAAQTAAQKAIEETEIIRLSVDDQLRFAASLLSPPAAAPALKRAFKAHRKLLGSK